MKPQEEVGGVGGAAATTTGKAANCQRICESVWVEVEEEKAVAKVLHRLRERDCVSGAVGRRRVGEKNGGSVEKDDDRQQNQSAARSKQKTNSNNDNSINNDVNCSSSSYADEESGDKKPRARDDVVPVDREVVDIGGSRSSSGDQEGDQQRKPQTHIDKNSNKRSAASYGSTSLRAALRQQQIIEYERQLAFNQLRLQQLQNEELYSQGRRKPSVLLQQDDQGEGGDDEDDGMLLRQQQQQFFHQHEQHSAVGRMQLQQLQNNDREQQRQYQHHQQQLREGSTMQREMLNRYHNYQQLQQVIHRQQQQQPQHGNVHLGLLNQHQILREHQYAMPETFLAMENNANIETSAASLLDLGNANNNGILASASTANHTAASSDSAKGSATSSTALPLETRGDIPQDNMPPTPNTRGDTPKYMFPNNQPPPPPREDEHHSTPPPSNGELIPVPLKDWLSAPIHKLSTNQAYLQCSVKLALLLTQRLIRSGNFVKSSSAAAENSFGSVGNKSGMPSVEVEDLIVKSTVVYITDPRTSSNNGRDAWLEIEEVDIEGLSSSNTSDEGESPPLNQSKVCLALGKIFFELFTKGVLYSKVILEEQCSSSTPEEEALGALLSLGREDSTVKDSHTKRQATTSSSSSSQIKSPSVQAKEFILNYGLPLSIGQLISDLLNTESQGSPLCLLNEVEYDLMQMKKFPQSFLFDRTCSDVAYRDMNIHNNTKDMQLYGRDLELHVLQRMAARVSSCANNDMNEGNEFACEVAFLSGGAGIGKTSLIRKFVSTCDELDGWFLVTSKFDRQVSSLVTVSFSWGFIFFA